MSAEVSRIDLNLEALAKAESELKERLDQVRIDRMALMRAKEILSADASKFDDSFPFPLPSPTVAVDQDSNDGIGLTDWVRAALRTRRDDFLKLRHVKKEVLAGGYQPTREGWGNSISTILDRLTKKGEVECTNTPTGKAYKWKDQSQNLNGDDGELAWR